MLPDRPPIAADGRAGEGGRNPEGTGVTQRLRCQWAVDRERPALVEARARGNFGHDIKEGDEAARGQHRRRVIGGLRAGAQADGQRTERLGHLGEEVEDVVVTLDRHGRSRQGCQGAVDVRERDQRVEGSTGGAGGARGRQDLDAMEAARVDERLAGVEVETGGDGRDRVVGDREDCKVALVEDRGRLDERPGARDELAKAVPARRVAAGHGADLPAGSGEGCGEGQADRAAAHDPDDGPAVARGGDVRVGVRLEVHLVTMAVRPGRQRRIGGRARASLARNRRRVLGATGDCLLRRRLAQLLERGGVTGRRRCCVTPGSHVRSSLAGTPGAGPGGGGVLLAATA